MNFKQVIESFVEGATDGSSAGQGNLWIKDNILFHYQTPILERHGDKYILNFSRYSIVTGRLQKQIKEIVSSDSIIQITKVSEGYKGSLCDFIKAP